MTYRSPTQSMRHQLAAMAACRAKPPVPASSDAFAYLMDMGTGKTKVILDEWGEAADAGGLPDLLVFGPKGSLRNWYTDKGDDDDADNWGELRKHLDPEFAERLVHHTWIGSGAGWEKRMRLLMGCTDRRRPRALFVNVEAMSTSAEALQLCLDFVEQRGAMVVVDESTTIKSDSKRTEAVVAVGKLARARRVMSGLWTPKSPMDLYWQCEFLDSKIIGKPNYWSFQARYAVLKRTMIFVPGGKTRWIQQVVDYKNMDELRERVGKYSYRVLKKDCLDLAPKSYAPRDVELTTEQKKMMQELKLFGHSAIPGRDDRFVTTDMITKRIVRELQIACGFVMDDEERVLHEVAEKKTQAMLDVLADHEGKTIIWCPWHPPLQRIVRVLTETYGHKSVAQFHGKNVRDRDAEERRFLTDPECTFMVATQGAGMRGNTWTVADLTIYYANNYDLEQREQSEDRNHRKGQKNRVTYVDLVTQSEIEKKVVKNLRKKIDLATSINKEGHRAWVI